MRPVLTTSRQSFAWVRSSYLILWVCFVLFCGCKHAFEADDPQLKPIQTMLEKNVPIGSTEGAVTLFLSTRGYPMETPEKPGTLVAIIRHIDTEKLQPVTARVTFYFDADEKLKACEIVRTRNAPIPQ